MLKMSHIWYYVQWHVCQNFIAGGTRGKEQKMLLWKFVCRINWRKCDFFAYVFYICSGVWKNVCHNVTIKWYLRKPTKKHYHDRLPILKIEGVVIIFLHDIWDSTERNLFIVVVGSKKMRIVGKILRYNRTLFFIKSRNMLVNNTFPMKIIWRWWFWNVVLSIDNIF